MDTGSDGGGTVRQAAAPQAAQAQPPEAQLNINQIVMNYLVLEGHKEAAEVFQRESGEEPKCDLAQVETRMKIRGVVQSGDISTAIEMVNDLNPEILDNDTRLYFRLYRQRLIELISEGKIEDALNFAEAELAPLGEDSPECMEDLEEAMALFAFPDKAGCPVKHLLEPAQRQMTASEINRSILESQSQDTRPWLHWLLKLLMYSQKLLKSREVDIEHLTLSGDPCPSAEESMEQ